MTTKLDGGGEVRGLTGRTTKKNNFFYCGFPKEKAWSLGLHRIMRLREIRP